MLRAEEPPRAGLVDRALEHVLHVEEFAADVDVGDLRPDRVAADRAPFDQQVRIALDQQVILEGARLALVGVAGDVARLGLLVDELPLQPGRESGAAAAAQPGGLDHVDDLVRLLVERLLQRRIAVVLEIEVQREGIRLADVFREDWIHLAAPACHESTKARSINQIDSSCLRVFVVACSVHDHRLALHHVMASRQRGFAARANVVDERRRGLRRRGTRARRR